MWRTIFIICACIITAHCWDSEELELFDVVEEVNENFYTVLGISQDATLGEVKKAYRRLSLVLHPDKNDAPDAEEKFRQLVSIYDILRDENRRARYNRVLVEGLPDWRSPIYYYRRARKMGMFEIIIILTVVISLTQYLMAWGSYIDKKNTMEEFLMKKYKIKDWKKKKQDDISMIESELATIPTPSWKNILPIQLVKLIVFIVTCGPGIIKNVMNAMKEERERKKQELIEKEEEEKLFKEEEEKKKAKKASRKEARKKNNRFPDFANGGCILDPVEGSDSEGQSAPPPKPAPVYYNFGPWTDDEFNELARLMKKYPGGTLERWDKISEALSRPVHEVTKMADRLKNQILVRQPEEETAPVVKVKVKTKAEKTDLSAGSDELWTPVQQKALEKAIKENPKGTDQRWDKIAKGVPDKTKEECMLRFKFLAEKIKKKKEDETREKVEEEEEEKDSEEPASNDSENCEAQQEECQPLDGLESTDNETHSVND